jgi:hypothetical protein
MNEHAITKEWLKNNPYNGELPKGWEVRFGIRGKFMKYDSIEHAERKNMIFHRELKKEIPFGYVSHQWEALKSNYKDGDELWIVGNDGMIVYLIRDSQIAYDYYGKYKSPKNGFYVILSGC